MDFLTELGSLALASRLRRLTDRLAQDVAHIYKAQAIDFEPRWFPIYYLLCQKAPLGVMDIARLLGVSHPAVNQIAGEMIHHGLVMALKDDNDKRKRLLTLTEEGQTLKGPLSEIWNGVQATVDALMIEAGSNLISAVDDLEGCLDRKPIHARFQDHMQATQPKRVEIIAYASEFRDDFKRLNLEWIEKHFEVEPADRDVLNNPEEVILANGGSILFARDPESGEVLGTCALLRKSGDSLELAKMAVTERAQGRQIGKQLLSACIERARQMQVTSLELETNSKLTAAVGLYQRLGFEDLPCEPGDSSYRRVDRRMRLTL